MLKTVEEQVVAQVQYSYEITSAVLPHLDVDDGVEMRYTTYGIKALGEDGREMARFEDVCTNKEFVSGIVEKLNHSQADVLHLKDIILDNLG